MTNRRGVGRETETDRRRHRRRHRHRHTHTHTHIHTGYAIWIAALTVFWLLMTDNLPHMWKMFTIVLYSK